MAGVANVQRHQVTENGGEPRSEAQVHGAKAGEQEGWAAYARSTCRRVAGESPSRANQKGGEVGWHSVAAKGGGRRKQPEGWQGEYPPPAEGENGGRVENRSYRAR